MKVRKEGEGHTREGRGGRRRWPAEGVFWGVAVSRDYREDRSVSGESSKHQRKTRPFGEKLLQGSFRQTWSQLSLNENIAHGVYVRAVRVQCTYCQINYGIYILARCLLVRGKWLLCITAQHKIVLSNTQRWVFKGPRCISFVRQKFMRKNASKLDTKELSIVFFKISLNILQQVFQYFLWKYWIILEMTPICLRNLFEPFLNHLETFLFFEELFRTSSVGHAFFSKTFCTFLLLLQKDCQNFLLSFSNRNSNFLQMFFESISEIL